MKRKRKRKTASVRYLNPDLGRRRVLATRATRGGDAWRTTLRRLTVVVILLAMLGGVVVALMQGLRWAGRRVLWENDVYQARVLNVRVDGRLSREHVLEFMDLPESINLWELMLGRRGPEGGERTRDVMTIDQIRENFLKRVPSVSDVEIAVLFPDRLDIRVKERVPFAVVGAGNADFVVDRHGVVFFDPRYDAHLPLIIGVTSQNLMPGIDLSETLTPTLRLLDMVRQPRYNRDIAIRRLNVAAGEYLECWLDNGIHVTIAWTGMDESGEAGDKHLELKLDSLRSIIRDSRETGRRLQSVDLTLSEDNIPATLKSSRI